MANSVKVRHQDGTEYEYPMEPSAIVKAEEYINARGRTLQTAVYLSTAYAAYVQARRRGHTDAAFSDWLDTTDTLTESSESEDDVEATF